MFAVKNSTNRNEARSPAAEMIAGTPANPSRPMSFCCLVASPPPMFLPSILQAALARSFAVAQLAGKHRAQFVQQVAGLLPVTFRIIWHKIVNNMWRTELGGRGKGKRRDGGKRPLRNPVAIPERNAIQFRNAQTPANRETAVLLQNRSFGQYTEPGARPRKLYAAAFIIPNAVTLSPQPGFGKERQNSDHVPPVSTSVTIKAVYRPSSLSVLS